MTARVDAVVVGAGVIGLSAAWRLRAHGLGVLVLDPDAGGGATHAAAGMLGAGSEAWFGHDELRRWCTRSWQAWPAFRSELATAAGVDLPWAATRTFAVAVTAADAPALRRHAELIRACGLGASEVSVREAVAREPALTPRLAAALDLDEPAVDPRAVVLALRRALERAGVPVRAVAVGAVGTGSVRLADGETLAAGHVVVAAGHATRAIDGVPRDLLDGLHAVKGQILRLSAPRAGGLVDVPTHVVRGLVDGRPVYVVPHGGGRVAVGATSEDRDDLTVTAGGVHRLLDDALRLVPGLDEFTLDEAIARLRPATDSHVPVVREVSPGVVVAAGHGRNGVLLAPATADAVVQLVARAGPAASAPPPTAPAAPAVATVRRARADGVAAVRVNGEEAEWAVDLAVSALLARLRPDLPAGRGVAVAVDSEVVPRHRWDDVLVGAGQQVEVLTAIQGG
ncbi:MAG: sulfur carrier protein ThiS [Kineosporiaceae bacterium]